MNEPWYSTGLRFACTGCGDCCTGEPGYVWVSQAEIEALAAAQGLSVEQFEQRYVRRVGVCKSLIERDNGDCVFFDAESRRCRVYELRPRQCRTWPFWPANLVSPATWEQTADRCRGCNRGRLVPLDQIKGLGS
jgi:Fe-S-cluster containining protein